MLFLIYEHFEVKIITEITLCYNFCKTVCFMLYLIYKAREKDNSRSDYLYVFTADYLWYMSYGDGII